MAGNVPYDLDGDGHIGAYEMAIYDQDQNKASNWRQSFLDSLNDKLIEACEAAEQILASYKAITSCTDNTLPMKLIYHELMRGITEKHLWNQRINEPNYVFLDQLEFYPAKLLLSNFHRYFPAPCDFAIIEKSLSSEIVLFQQEAELSTSHCGDAWELVVENLAMKDEDAAENLIVDLVHAVAQLFFAFLDGLHLSEQFSYADQLSKQLNELCDQWRET